MWKVLKTSWLENPSRSRARGRSPAMNEPVAAKFLRVMISAGLVVPVRRRGVGGGQALEGGLEVLLLGVGVAGLAQLVAAREAQRLDPVPHGRVGVVPEPARRLHDVSVGVVDDPQRVVRHRISSSPVAVPSLWAEPASAAPGRPSSRWPGSARRPASRTGARTSPDRCYGSALSPGWRRDGGPGRRRGPGRPGRGGSRRASPRGTSRRTCGLRPRRGRRPGRSRSHRRPGPRR